MFVISPEMLAQSLLINEGKQDDRSVLAMTNVSGFVQHAALTSALSSSENVLTPAQRSWKTKEISGLSPASHAASTTKWSGCNNVGL